MRKYIFKRLIYMVIALFCIITLTFLLMRIAPGNPFASEKALPANIQAQLNKQYGLSNPWYIQFRDYLVGILKFDFGYSMKYRGRSTNDIIFSSFPVSLALGMQALVIAVGLGTTLGVISATYHNKVRDYAATVVAVLGISVPSFILAGLIQYLFAVHLGWFPVSGWKGFSYTILPSFALGLGFMGNIAKLTRSSMLEQNTSEYVKLAKAKGLSKWKIVFKHTLRNALLPVVSYLGPLLAGVVTGSFIVENIFAIPGLGGQFVKSITNRDYTVIMGTTVFYSILLLFAVLVVDIVYMWIDPRIKLEGGESA